MKFNIGDTVVVCDNTEEHLFPYIKEGDVGVVEGYDKHGDVQLTLDEGNIRGVFSSVTVAEHRLKRMENEMEKNTNSGEWITWAGGDCPVPEATRVTVKLRDGYETKEQPAGFFIWSHTAGGSDIVSYKVANEHSEPSNKRTAEEIAPELWNAYKDILNEEALIALRQVIEDEEQHEEIKFADSKEVWGAFRWEETEQGYVFWADVGDGLYNKAQESHSEHLYTDSRLKESVKQLKDVKDIGSAATSRHYNEKLIQPIEIAQMVLTEEEFIGAMKFNIMKYSQRAGSKEGESSVKDWNKSLQYKYWLELALEGNKIDPRKDVV